MRGYAFFFVDKRLRLCKGISMEQEIVEEVKSFLEGKKIPAQLLAQQAGVNPSIISRFLSGKNTLSLKNYRKIMAVIRKF